MNGPRAIQEREAMLKRYALKDAQWECIKGFLPGQPGQCPATRRSHNSDATNIGHTEPSVESTPQP
jgi:hypothetical protein